MTIVWPGSMAAAAVAGGLACADGCAGVGAIDHRSLQEPVRRQVGRGAGRQRAGGAGRDQDTGDLTCPPVTVRAGASTYAVAAPGKQPVGNDLRFQATITKMARECTVNGGVITARIGIQGRVIAGPAGAPSSVQVPIRVAVVQGGVSEKTIATKAYQTTVNDDRRRQRAVHAGGRGSRLSGALRRGRRQLHLLYRLRPAGPEARTPRAHEKEVA